MDLYLLCQGHALRAFLLGMCLHQESHLGLAIQHSGCFSLWKGDLVMFRNDELEINMFKIIR